MEPAGSVAQMGKATEGSQWKGSEGRRKSNQRKTNRWFCTKVQRPQDANHRDLPKDRPNQLDNSTKLTTRSCTPAAQARHISAPKTQSKNLDTSTKRYKCWDRSAAQVKQLRAPVAIPKLSDLSAKQPKYWGSLATQVKRLSTPTVQSKHSRVLTAQTIHSGSQVAQIKHSGSRTMWVRYPRNKRAIPIPNTHINCMHDVPKCTNPDEPAWSEAASKSTNVNLKSAKQFRVFVANGLSAEECGKDLANSLKEPDVVSLSGDELNESLENGANRISDDWTSSRAATTRDGPLVVRKDIFDRLNLVPGTHEFIQNGEIELIIEEPDEKDYIQLILFECCGEPENPKQVVRDGYKICAVCVLHRDTPTEVVREAVLDLAEQLEKRSHDSLFSDHQFPYDVNKYSLPYLEKRYIYPLKKKSVRFAQAVYFCRLCQCHICSVSQAVSHFTSFEHVNNEEKIENLKKLECLPKPVVEQVFKLSQIVRERYALGKFTDLQYETGTEIAKFLSFFLQKKVHRSFSVTIYGSYLMKLATADSNLNLELTYPLEYTLDQAFSRVIDVLGDPSLEKCFTVDSIKSDFQRADPSIRCTVNSVPVIITTNCLRQKRTTQLIILYCSIRSQFKILATVFRLWAKECLLTKLQLGGMPTIAFDIMLIYYLQQKGLLPFVFEILDEDELLSLDSESLDFYHRISKINSVFGTDNGEWNLGELWVGLFRYFAVEHPVDQLIQMRWKVDNFPENRTRWNKKRLAIEDPFAPDHVMQPQQYISVYFSNCFLSTFLYFALPRTAIRSLIPYSVSKSVSVLVRGRKNKKRKTPKSTVSERNIVIDTQQKIDFPDCVGSRKVEFIEMQGVTVDTVKEKPALLTKSDTNVLKQGCLGKICETATTAIQEKCKMLTLSSTLQQQISDEILDRQGKVASSRKAKIWEGLVGVEKHRERDTAVENINQNSALTNLGRNESSNGLTLASTSGLKIKFEDYDEESVRKLWKNLCATDYAYPWNSKFFTSGSVPEVRCACCNAKGHLQDGCPELNVPEPKNLPPLNASQKRLINEIVYDVFATMRMKPCYMQQMSKLCREVEIYLRRFYRPDCRLSLFGSAGNGFGLMGSDADICLRFGSNIKSEDIDPVEVLSKIAEVIRDMPNVIFVCAVINAKVPIVKFRCRGCDYLEADLSLYNVLALENTRLLRSYSDLDRRIHQLGVMTKEWAKSCEIGDASKGSLSSYSFIILLIHYLQRTNPPVAPFLQEIGKGKTRRIIDHCDVYFCSLKDLNWKIRNHASVGELWVNFLDYFATKFDFMREVVQIRHMQPLMKLDKGWQSRPIAIEDPFDLNHNLSSGVHFKMLVYIRKSFIRSREIFRTLVAPKMPFNPMSFVRFASFTMQNCRVGDGPPHDRSRCHRCRQIGHFVANCPIGLRNRKIKNKLKSLRNRQIMEDGRRQQCHQQSVVDIRDDENSVDILHEKEKQGHKTSISAEPMQALLLNEQDFSVLCKERLDVENMDGSNGYNLRCRPAWHRSVLHHKNLRV